MSPQQAPRREAQQPGEHVVPAPSQKPAVHLSMGVTEQSGELPSELQQAPRGLAGEVEGAAQTVPLAISAAQLVP